MLTSMRAAVKVGFDVKANIVFGFPAKPSVRCWKASGISSLNGFLLVFMMFLFVRLPLIRELSFLIN